MAAKIVHMLLMSWAGGEVEAALAGVPDLAAEVARAVLAEGVDTEEPGGIAPFGNKAVSSLGKAPWPVSRTVLFCCDLGLVWRTVAAFTVTVTVAVAVTIVVVVVVVVLLGGGTRALQLGWWSVADVVLRFRGCWMDGEPHATSTPATAATDINGARRGTG
ncbi:hypothetical protein BGZ61DRAFT_487797 [Ilyonectria robusta]|uniref:uncharacterized protein n=1 Tax=Ilyonectria robusta TaxID=1079257 RepID=UPI001E8E8E30|nr:uncharacterized protein BGZ61DRAFT_487797 [Ilyonectria robusta]KAH8650690.1 hypothetical protein BGZ61DRAFT_487797 [Ilyonectria robusta]